MDKRFIATRSYKILAFGCSGKNILKLFITGFVYFTLPVVNKKTAHSSRTTAYAVGPNGQFSAGLKLRRSLMEIMATLVYIFVVSASGDLQ